MPSKPHKLNPLHRAARRGLRHGATTPDALLITATKLAAGVEQGRHRGRDRGSSTEFFDFRPYSEGDDPRRIDWRLQARTDRHYVRRFHHDARLTLLIGLDASASMDFAGLERSADADHPTKLERAVELAAALAAIATRQGDRVGLLIAGHESNDQPVVTLPPASGRVGLIRLVAALARTQPGPLAKRDPADPGPLATLASVAAGHARHATRLFLIGDAFEPPAPLAQRLAATSERPRLIAVRTRDELSPSLTGPTRLLDPETAQRRDASHADVRSIADRLRAHDDALRRALRRTRGALIITPTSDTSLDNLVQALSG